MAWQELLDRLAPKALPEVRAAFECSADAVFAMFAVNTALRQAHFLAQALHETGGFTRIEENLNYSAERLLQVFPKYFDAATAQSCARNPERIANRVYARASLGNTSPGDGWRYRGRGIFQLTGKSNYTRMGKLVGIPLAVQPELATSPNYLLRIAGAYWDSRGINAYADADDITSVTKLINGGTNGLPEREHWLVQAKEVLEA